MRKLTLTSMTIGRFFVALIVFAVATSASADQPSHSNLSIWAESDEYIVLHQHKARAWEVTKSIVRVVDKQSGNVVSEFETTPFTSLIPIADGKYFAGLSYFQASSYPHGYNFAVFTADGSFLVKAFVLHDSGHCENANQSVSQYVHWFDSYDPHITVKYDRNEIVEILVGDGHFEEPCKFAPGDYSLKIETE